MKRAHNVKSFELAPPPTGFFKTWTHIFSGKRQVWCGRLFSYMSKLLSHVKFSTRLGIPICPEKKHPSKEHAICLPKDICVHHESRWKQKEFIKMLAIISSFLAPPAPNSWAENWWFSLRHRVGKEKRKTVHFYALQKYLGQKCFRTKLCDFYLCKNSANFSPFKLFLALSCRKIRRRNFFCSKRTTENQANMNFMNQNAASPNRLLADFERLDLAFNSMHLLRAGTLEAYEKALLHYSSLGFSVYLHLFMFEGLRWIGCHVLP